MRLQGAPTKFAKEIKVARLADKIRQSDDRFITIVDIPEWDVKVGVKSMTALQRANMQNDWSADEDGAAIKLYKNVLLHCCYEPDTGDAVFTEEDLDWLFAEKSAQSVDKLAQECLKVSGLASDSVDTVGKDS